MSVLQSELENLGEILVIQEGRNLFSEFDLVQTFRNPANHKPIDPKLIQQMGRDLIGQLEQLHSIGFVHACIKPQNIKIIRDENKVRFSIINYCNGIQITNPDGSLKPQTKSLEKKGSLVFKAESQIKMLTPGYKDDIESLIMVLYFLSKGTLPVIKYITMKKQQSANLDIENEVLAYREGMAAAHYREIYDGLPSNMKVAWSYINQLKYNQKPDYKLLRLYLCETEEEEVAVLKQYKNVLREVDDVDSVDAQNADDSWMANSQFSFDLQCQEKGNDNKSLQINLNKIDMAQLRKEKMQEYMNSKMSHAGV